MGSETHHVTDALDMDNMYRLAARNTCYRQVLWTGKDTQTVIQTLKPYQVKKNVVEPGIIHEGE